jgi:hypothetical protein
MLTDLRGVQSENASLRSTIASFNTGIPVIRDAVREIRERNEIQTRYARRLNEFNAIIRFSESGYFIREAEHIRQLRGEIRELVRINMTESDETRALEREISRMERLANQ